MIIQKKSYQHQDYKKDKIDMYKIDKYKHLPIFKELLVLLYR